MRYLFMLGLLATCQSTVAQDDSAGGSGSPDNGDGVSPVIDWGRVTCVEGSGSSGWMFLFEVNVEDPQGNDTIATTGTVAARNGDTVLMEEDLLICGDEGECSASFRDGSYPSLTCSTGGGNAYTARVSDTDGNLSNLFSLDWQDFE